MSRGLRIEFIKIYWYSQNVNYRSLILPCIWLAGGLAPGEEKAPSFARSPHFDRVMERLDVGGKSLHYRDHEGTREVLVSLVKTLAGLQPEVGLEIDAEALVDASGLAQAAASGRSMRKDGDSWLAKGYAYYPKKHTPLAEVLGEPVAFEGSSLLPAGTEFLLEGTLDTSRLLQFLFRFGRAFGSEEGLDSAIGNYFPRGYRTRVLLTRAQVHFVLGMELSGWNPREERLPDFVLQLKGAEKYMEIFRPAIEDEFGKAQRIGSRHGWILQDAREGDDDRAQRLLVDEEGTIVLVSSGRYLKQLEEGERLAADHDFVTATDHYPAEGNLMVFGSRRFLPVVHDLMKERGGFFNGGRASEESSLFGSHVWSAVVAVEKDGLSTMAEFPVAVDMNPGIALAGATAGGAMLAASVPWKKGSDRAGCIMNIRNVQQAVRSYQNMNGHSIGETLPLNQVIGPGMFVEQMPVCPAGGTYTFTKMIPQVGELACRCSHEHDKAHVPADHQDW